MIFTEQKMKYQKHLLFILTGCAILPIMCKNNLILNPNYSNQVVQKNNYQRNQSIVLPNTNMRKTWLCLLLIMSGVLYLYFNFNKFSMSKKIIIALICALIAIGGIFGFMPLIVFIVSTLISISISLIKGILSFIF